MYKVIIPLALALVIIIYALLVILGGIRVWIGRAKQADQSGIIAKLKRNALVMSCACAVLFLFVYLAHAFAYTPALTDANGQEAEGGVAELCKITINGREEWITIRGYDQSAPILLFLAGGPGGSQLAATRMKLHELEKDFVVVNWDQPGSGKSSRCMKRSAITVDTYIDDGVALTEYLRDRFGKKPIYLVGESWGSALCVFLAAEKPEYYAGIIGTGVMVDFEETEKIDYEKALELARARNDVNTVDKLVKQGPPLYYSGNIALQTTAYLNYLGGEMARNPETTAHPFNTLEEMTASEYGALDTFNYLLGFMNTFNVVYPQLYDVDLRSAYAELEVPIYFFLVRHDLNAPVSLAEDYFHKLAAPEKELLWFEHSGHTPWTYETDLFIQETKRVFLRRQ